MSLTVPSIVSLWLIYFPRFYMELTSTNAVQFIEIVLIYAYIQMSLTIFLVTNEHVYMISIYKCLNGRKINANNFNPITKSVHSTWLECGENVLLLLLCENRVPPPFLSTGINQFYWPPTSLGVHWWTLTPGPVSYYACRLTAVPQVPWM